MAKEGKKTNITFYEYKGATYVRIKEGNKPLKKWKLDGQTPIDVYLNYYRKRDQKPRGIILYKKEIMGEKRTTQKQAMQRYTKRLEKQGRLISTQIKTGITKTKINLLTAGQKEIDKAYRELLEPLVLDKELLNLLIQNAYKFRHRFQYETKVIGLDKETRETTDLAKVSETGRTIKEVQETYRHVIKQNGRIDSGTFRTQIMPFINKYNQDAKGMMWKQGTTKQLIATITFRRGNA